MLAAGCVTSPAEEPPGDASVARTMSWGLEGCTVAVAVVPVPASALVPHVPEGFRLLSPAEVGLPPDPRGDALFALETFSCALATADNESTEDAYHGGAFTFVEPPAELVDPEVDFFTFFRWDAAIASPKLRSFLADAGAPAYEGSASFTTATMPQAGGPLQAGLEVNGTSFTFTGAAQPPGGEFGGVFDEYFATPDGLLRWKTTGIAPFGQGGGSVQVSGGIAEEVLGAAPVPGYVVFLTDVAFVNGTATAP